MLFRPSYCCNCGEKIERVEWKLWTSRRFCELCSTDFAVQEYSVKGVILLVSVVAVFGVVKLLTPAKQPDLVAKKSVDRPSNTVVERNANEAVVQTPAQAVNSVEDRAPRTLAAMPAANIAARSPVAVAETVYMCGAATKKGAPCSRKVRANIRCWQHTGQPAMLPPDQLRVAR